MKKLLLLLTVGLFATGSVQAQTRYLNVSQSPALLPLSINPVGDVNPIPSCASGPSTAPTALPPGGGTLSLDANIAATFLPPTWCDHFVWTNVQVTVGGLPYGAPLSFCPGVSRTNVTLTFGGGVYTCLYDIVYNPGLNLTTIYLHP